MDLTAGEHIIDSLEIEARQNAALERVRGRIMAAIQEIDIDRHIPQPSCFSRPAMPRDISATITGNWTLNGEPLNVFDDNHIRRITMKLDPIVERLENVPNLTYTGSTMTITATPARHPSSQRFHDLLPVVAQMAYRFEADLAPAGASAWGIDAWKVPMRGVDLRLRKLQAKARGEAIANDPKILMLEIAALGMVAKYYYTDDLTTTWAHDYTIKMGATHDQKQADYGRDDDPFANVRASEDWSVAPWVGGMIRLTDKVRRLQSFAIKGSLFNESALDSLEDMSVYAVINAVLYDHEVA